MAGSLRIRCFIFSMVAVLFDCSHQFTSDLGYSSVIIMLISLFLFFFAITVPECLELSCIFPQFFSSSLSVFFIKLNFSFVFFLVSGVVGFKVAFLVLIKNASESFFKVWLIYAWLLKRWFFIWVFLWFFLWFFIRFSVSWAWAWATRTRSRFIVISVFFVFSFLFLWWRWSWRSAGSLSSPAHMFFSALI